MFIAKFNQVNSDKFKADKNTNMPFIGEIMAGKAKASLINGTMFLRDSLQTETLYACENTYNEEYGNYEVKIIAKVGLTEYLELRTKLGEGVLDLTDKAEASDEVPEEELQR